MSRRPNGPIEDRDVPSELQANVITPGPDPRVHGFSVESDLALHYRFPELVLIALTGDPPGEGEGRAFDIALQFLAPLAIAEAPTHAAVLTRLFGARTSSIVSVACIALAERARHVIEQHRDFLAWLDARQGDPPARYRSETAEDGACVERLQAALSAAGVTVPGLVSGLSRWAAILMTLHFAGIRRAEHVESVCVMASLAPTLAEALSHSAKDISRYPIKLPPFVYEETP